MVSLQGVEGSSEIKQNTSFIQFTPVLLHLMRPVPGDDIITDR